MKTLTELLRTQISEETRKKILSLYGNKCHYCGVDLNIFNTEIDHAIPVARNGSSEISNLRASCKKCNEEKGDKTEGEYLEWKRKCRQNAALGFLGLLTKGK